MKNELNNKPCFIIGFISAIIGAIGLLFRDNKNLGKGSRKCLIVGSSMLSAAGIISMLLSLDKSLLPVEEKKEEPEEDEDEFFEDDLD